MRIIAGKFGGRRLASPPETTRPTADRAREAIFNIIYSLVGNKMEEWCVLDAFAGSGALGFEALSRGASRVTFLEKSPQAIYTLKENINKLGIASQTIVVMGDAVHPPKAASPVDLIFLDPPYDQNLENACLTALSCQGWLTPDTLIIVETSAKRLPKLPTGAMLINQRRYGAALVSFLKFHATPDGMGDP